MRWAGTAGWTRCRPRCLLVKLRHIEQWNKDRQRIAARYTELFNDAGLAVRTAVLPPDDALVLPVADARATHVWHQYVVRAQRRDELRAHLTERGIGQRGVLPGAAAHAGCVACTSGYREGQFPESERAAREVLALPIYPELRDDEQERVVDAMAEFLR